MRRNGVFVGVLIGLMSIVAWPELPSAQAPAAQNPAAPAPGAPPAGGPVPGGGAAPGGGFRGRGGPPRPANEPSARDDARHKSFVEIAQRGNIDLLFMGDSITDWWA